MEKEGKRLKLTTGLEEILGYCHLQIKVITYIDIYILCTIVHMYICTNVSILCTIKYIQSFCVCVLSHFSHVPLFATQWTLAQQAPLSMGFSRQEYCSGLPCPPPRDLLIPGMEPVSLMSSALSGRFFTTRDTWKAPIYS